MGVQQGRVNGPAPWPLNPWGREPAESNTTRALPRWRTDLAAGCLPPAKGERGWRAAQPGPGATVWVGNHPGQAWAAARFSGRSPRGDKSHRAVQVREGPARLLAPVSSLIQPRAGILNTRFHLNSQTFGHVTRPPCSVHALGAGWVTLQRRRWARWPRFGWWVHFSPPTGVTVVYGTWPGQRSGTSSGDQKHCF